MARRNDLKTLRRMITKAYGILRNAKRDEESQCACLILGAALELTDRMLVGGVSHGVPPARVLGSRGGQQTAKRGSEYFRQIAAKRWQDAKEKQEGSGP